MRCIYAATVHSIASHMFSNWRMPSRIALQLIGWNATAGKREEYGSNNMQTHTKWKTQNGKIENNLRWYILLQHYFCLQFMCNPFVFVSLLHTHEHTHTHFESSTLEILFSVFFALRRWSYVPRLAIYHDIAYATSRSTVNTEYNASSRNLEGFTHRLPWQ